MERSGSIDMAVRRGRLFVTSRSTKEEVARAANSAIEYMRLANIMSSEYSA
jgi:hypothetical protein